jgi:hypothetical protein
MSHRPRLAPRATSNDPAAREPSACASSLFTTEAQLVPQIDTALAGLAREHTVSATELAGTLLDLRAQILLDTTLAKFFDVSE